MSIADPQLAYEYRDAMKLITQRTCLRFRERMDGDPAQYVNIVNDPGDR